MLITKFQGQLNGIFIMPGNVNFLSGVVKTITYFNRYGQWMRQITENH